MAKAFIDKYLNKFVSRKFTVWLTATGLLAFDKVDGDHWVYVSMIYIGTQAVIDAFIRWKGSNQ